MKIITAKRLIRFGGILLTCLLIASVITITPALAQGSGKENGNRYIVVVKKGESPEDVARDHGLAPKHVYKHALNGFATGKISQGEFDDLRADPRVKYVEKDKTFHAIGQTLPTGIDRIEADQNNTANINSSYTGVDVDIAIIDTGIDLDHPDLNVYEDVNYSTGSPSGDDGNGHGTHVAGIAAAIDDDKGVVGMAPGARLWAVKVLKNSGSGSLSDVIAGVDYVTEHADQIEVANMSLGAQGQSNSFRTAVQNSVGAGVVYVVAAGNDEEDVYGPDGTLGTDDDYIPAAYPEVATISALADSDGEPGGNGSDTSYGSDDSFASFTNFSESVIDNNPVDSPGAAIDLLMPGVEIYSTYKSGKYATMSGTSMSSPHAAGLAALYVAKNGRNVDGDNDNDSNDVENIRQALINEGVAQDSSNGLTTLDDPDNNLERIGWASSTSGNPPTVSWVNPTDGETITENKATIQIDATDNEDSDNDLTVDWKVDDGGWREAAYNVDNGYYEDNWDTGTVDDGDYSLYARAEDSDNNTVTASITVTVETTDNPPTVSWINPKDGDTVSDNVTVKIDADDDRDSADNLTVEYQIDNGSWRTASYDSNTGNYTDTWDTTDENEGDHNLSARAEDTSGNVSSEKRITVTVNNQGGGMYVWDISWKEAGPHLKSTVTVLYDSDGDGVAESSDDPVSDATVDFTLSLDSDGDGSYDDDDQSYTGTTDSKGQVEFMWKHAPSGDYKGEVTGLTHSSYDWNSSLDADNPDYYTKG